MAIGHTSHSKASTNKVLMVAAYNTYIPHASVSGYRWLFYRDNRQPGGPSTEVAPLRQPPNCYRGSLYSRQRGQSASRAAVREQRS